jgi:hypothetical protein
MGGLPRKPSTTAAWADGEQGSIVLIGGGLAWAGEKV